jgi:hypothetical protein
MFIEKLVEILVVCFVACAVVATLNIVGGEKHILFNGYFKWKAKRKKAQRDDARRELANQMHFPR